MRPNGIGVQTAALGEFRALPLRDLPGIAVARSCGGMIVDARFDDHAAAEVRRRLLKILV
jgi:hypothetical protein